MNRKLRNVLLVISALLLISFGVFFFYTADAYEPAPEAMTAFDSTPTVTVEQNESYFAFLPADFSMNAGVIFYQGGKVEEEAYAPLMHQLAENGVPAYLLSLPFNLALLDTDAALEVLEEETGIQHWYTAGHSLGGVAAASFAEEHAEKLAGVILLASYPAGDLSAADLPVLSIYGDRDTVLDMESFSEGTASLPEAEVVVLEGGNHAQFGHYGMQEGDSPASISAEEQQSLTVEAILRFISETSVNR